MSSQFFIFPLTLLCSRRNSRINSCAVSIIGLANRVGIERYVEIEHPEPWRCELSSERAKDEPGVILLINRG
jgi:hypothetical protein